MIAKVRVPEAVVSEYVDGEVVLLHLDSGTYYRLNETGARMWRLLEASGDPAAVAETMATEFEVDRPTVVEDLDVLVHDLIAHGLLVEA